ncbi:RdgB/HAM1 family non-canonical purine NTP pyrophosphatase [Pusillimonas sp.]|uniref:RdgB/HAM1 family non-canonical purine NTP pyrophosphatase n=1 Tax=Pusillimonas sp. TaxID=3040095 RepID=UPI0037CBC4BF
MPNPAVPTVRADESSQYKVVLASNNPGKLKEFSAILSGVGIQMVPQGLLGVSETDEPYTTFIENALEKARHASRHTGLPALADDSGLCVDCLGGAPGVYSARYASLQGGQKSDAANNQHLLHVLEGETDRAASYVAVLVYVRSADDPRPIVAEGVWRGSIAKEPAGENGFGYDPYFFLPDLGMTAAELPAEEKNRHSHRARALSKLLKALANDEG